jgi:GDP/UDP-N,N'-diacetylbacillosamine 2-epimerase (hydrolysing)
MPNADTEGRVLFRQIKDFCRLYPNAKAYTSLGQLRYLSCIQQVDGVVGNSSSGLAEVPSFKKGTINIGDRQRGRIQANSVIDCEPERQAISAALAHLFSDEFHRKLSVTKNPYGNGGASEAIIKTLEEQPLNNLLKKRFYDLPL